MNVPDAWGSLEYRTSYRSIVSHTVGILHRNADTGAVAMGSGVLVEIANRLFVATAYHCIEDEPVILVDGMGVDTVNLPTAHVRILDRGGDPQLDIGFLELETGKKIVTEDEHKPCSVSQCILYPEPVNQVFHLTGCPSFDRTVGQRTISQYLSVFAGTVVEMDEDNLYFEFGNQLHHYNPATDTEEAMAVDSPQGFSGGGCWGITKSKDDELYDPSKTCLLLAIQSGWMRSSRRCRAPLIKRWLRLLARRYRELHPALMEAMKRFNINSDE
jgi:hypothetical protein